MFTLECPVDCTSLTPVSGSTNVYNKGRWGMGECIGDGLAGTEADLDVVTPEITGSRPFFRFAGSYDGIVS